MATNPLFPSDQPPVTPSQQATGQVTQPQPSTVGHAPSHQTAHHRPTHHTSATTQHTTVDHQEPVPDNKHDTSSDAAVNLIRNKLERLYADEPEASQEIEKIEHIESNGPRLSKHQQFMHDLSQSGKSLAQIQTEWHHYYANLPDDDKHTVWQEFYSQSGQGHEHNQAQQHQPRVPSSVYPTATSPNTPASFRQPASTVHSSGTADTATAADPTDLQPAPIFEYEDTRETAEIKQQLLDTVGKRAKLKPRHHIQSLLFGLGCGGLALLMVLFSFFNEIVIAPFIQPSRTVSATPIIIGADGIAPSDKAEVIIPKINVQIPLDFTAKTIREDDIQKALESGVVHYPTTVMPGQQGNAAFFGHSSNNIFNPGKYKFAFVLLNEMVPGDTFYLTRDGIAYAYVVFDKKVIDPTEISILDPIAGKSSTATLITCDPPGTTLKRLAIIGEQISPNPNANIAAEVPAIESPGNKELPGNPPTLWHRLTGWITS